jgi:type IV pilus assembly protein PilW
MKVSKDNSSRFRQGGRTLLELLISITIGLIILAVLFAVYLATRSTSQQSATVSRMTEDAAIAFNMLGSSLKMAGYSGFRVLVLPGGALINGVKYVAPDRNFVGTAIRGCDFGFVDDAADFANLTCAPSGNSAAFAIRFEGDLFSTVPVSGQPSDCLASGINSNIYHKSVVNTSITYPLVESRYSVLFDSRSSSSNLYCGGNGSDFYSQPIVQLVKSMQIRYGVGGAPDSRDVQQYMTAAQVEALPGDLDEKWSRVINLRICMVLESQVRDQAGPSNYIDCDGTSVASSDGLARKAFTTVYALRNRSGFLTP